MDVDIRKQQTRDARNNERNNSGFVYLPDDGAWRQWRVLKGGVTMINPEPKDNTSNNNPIINDKAISEIEYKYRNLLERRLQKQQDMTKKDIKEFESMLSQVIKQIHAQKAKEARHRKKIKPKPGNQKGVLISGDIIEKTESNVQDENIKKTNVEDWSSQMKSIVTVKISSGDSVEVFSKGIDSSRIEYGPQVLILSSSEQLVGATFILNSRNASFKPEFNWQAPVTDSPVFDFASPSFYSFNFNNNNTNNNNNNNYYSPSIPSSSHHSFSFDSPAPSFSFDMPFGNNNIGSSNPYSFQMDNPTINNYSYSTVDNDATGVSRFGIPSTPEDNQDELPVASSHKSPQDHLRELLEKRDEVNKVRSVFSEGFMSESEFHRRMAEISKGSWDESGDFEQSLNSLIERVQKEIEDATPTSTPSKQSENNSNNQSKNVRNPRRGALSGGEVQNGRGGIQNGRGGTPNRGRGAPTAFIRPSRGASRGGAGGASNRGRGAPRGNARGGNVRGGRGRGAMRGGRLPKSAGDSFSDISSMCSEASEAIDQEEVENESWDTIAVSKREAKINEYTQHTQNCLDIIRFLSKYVPKDNLDDYPNLRRYMSATYYPLSDVYGVVNQRKLQREREREREQQEKEKSQQEENPYESYSNYNPDVDINNNDNNNDNNDDNNIQNFEQGEASNRENNTNSRNKTRDENEDGYLSSGLFLTDDDEGYYYEKKSEERTKKKKKSRQRQLLVVPVPIFLKAAELGIFPPSTLDQVPEAIRSTISEFEKSKDAWVAESDAEQCRQEEREKKRQEKREGRRKEKQQKVATEQHNWMANEKEVNNNDNENENDKDDEDDDSVSGDSSDADDKDGGEDDNEERDEKEEEQAELQQEDSTAIANNVGEDADAVDEDMLHLFD